MTFSTVPPNSVAEQNSNGDAGARARHREVRHREEIEILERIFDEVRSQNTGRAVILHGPMSDPTASLLEEWRQELHRRRESVFEADCLPGAGAYAPLAELTTRYLRAVENMGLVDEPLSELYGAVARSLGITVMSPPPRRHPGRVTAQEQVEFYDTLGRLYVELSKRLSGIFIFKDLHRADSATKAAVLFLLQYVVTDPICSFTPDGVTTQPFTGLFVVSVSDDDGLAGIIRRQLAGHTGVCFIDLKGATEETVRRFLSQPEVLRRFVESTGGSPDNLQALLETIPHNVEDLFLRRCAQLDATQLEVLGALAVCGKPVPPDLLLHLLDDDRSGGLLADLFKKGVVSRRVHRGQLLIDLPTEDNRRVIYRRIDPEKRAELHGRYADLLQQRVRYGEQADLAELAQHYLESSHRRKAVEYAMLAAERLHISFAFEQAAELLEAVLPHLDASADRRAVLDRLVDLHACLSSHRRALYYCGLMKKELAPHQRGPLYRRIADVLLQMGDYRSALRLSNRARDLLESFDSGDDRTEEEVRIDTVSAEAYYGQARYDRVIAVCKSGLGKITASPRAESQRLAIHLNNTLGKVHLIQEDYGRAREIFERNLSRAQEYHWPDEAIRARFNLGTVALQLREYARAEEIFTVCLNSGRGITNPVIRAFVLMNLGVAYHKTNRFHKALDAYLHSLATFKRSGNDLQFAVVAMNLGALYQRLGDLSRARQLIETGLEIMRSRSMRYYEGWANYILGSIALDDGDFDLAEKALQTALDVMIQHGGSIWLKRIEVRRCRVLLERNEPGACRRRLDTLLSPGATREEKEIESEARYYLARAEIALGRCDVAWTALQQARKLCLEVEALDRLWLVDLLLAEADRDRGRNLEAVDRLEESAASLSKLAGQLPPILGRIFIEMPQRKRVFEMLEEIRSLREKPTVPAPSLPLPDGSRFAVWRSRYERIVGHDRKLLQIFRMIDRVADSESTVLIQGESGTGKELIAEAIHQNSSRRERPFVKVNCAAFVENLLLSELFGHEKGAFTGAMAKKKGRFELAHGGTLFLDEIGDISQNTQIALLRVLQEQTFERVGSSEPIEVDVRVIVATNRNLEQMVKQGDFRLDLYYRLKGIIIELPPLRSRRGDIVLLLQHFAHKFRADHPGQCFSRDGLDFLARYSWPGNVRELENFARNMTLFVDEPVIELHHILQFKEFFDDGEMVEELPPDFFEQLERSVQASEDPPAGQTAPAHREGNRPRELTHHRVNSAEAAGEAMMIWAREEGLGLPDLKRRLEVEYIKYALVQTQGNITQAANLLDMKRPRLSQIVNSTPELLALKETLISD